ncbi:MAG: hypothetical protein HGA75_01350 [Thiobacillus sp.]|nr:hypothetical protein [Thiobacillus sp.]
MDLSVPATTAYPPSQTLVREGGVRANLELAARSNSGTDERRVRPEASPASAEAQKAREESARKQEANTEAVRNPGFTFEYEGRHEIMKVHNGKGFLIYQVPSKGQLALVEAEDSAQQRNQQIRLFA